MSERHIDIRWRDLDALGHVNQAVYHTYAEEVLDGWLRDRLGLAVGETWSYVTARVAIDYRSELRPADGHVVGTCHLASLGDSSVTVRIELRAPDGRLAAEVETVIVAWEGESRRSRPLAAGERRALQSTGRPAPGR